MSDKFRELSEREQRTEMMRRDGIDFGNDEGREPIPSGNGPSSKLVRSLWEISDEEVEYLIRTEAPRPTVRVVVKRPTPINPVQLSYKK